MKEDIEQTKKKMASDADRLFKRLDVELSENIAYQYFREPREFPMIEVFTVINERVELLYL